jgi:hypothetical protein
MTTREPDENGFSTSLTPLGDGTYGVRVYRNGQVLMEKNGLPTKEAAAAELKDLLRWVDKMGWDSPMASASRDRPAKKEWARRKPEVK